MGRRERVRRTRKPPGVGMSVRQGRPSSLRERGGACRRGMDRVMASAWATWRRRRDGPGSSRRFPTMLDGPKYYTRLLERSSILAELGFACTRLMQAGVNEVEFMFGWGCELPDDQLWQRQTVRTETVQALVLEAERDEKLILGDGDVFVESADFKLLLCHESDIHVEGSSPLVQEVVERWRRLEILGPAAGLKPD